MEKENWDTLVANLKDLTIEIKKEKATSLFMVLDIKDRHMVYSSTTDDLAELGSMINMCMRKSKKFDDLIRSCVKIADISDREEYLKSNFS